jgi:hypothetical protein
LPPVDKICFANESYCNIKTCNPPSVNTLCQYSVYCIHTYISIVSS